MKTTVFKSVRAKTSAIAAAIMASPAVAFAGGGDDLGVAGPLTKVYNALSGPVLVVIVGLAILCGALLYLVSEHQGPMKTIMRIVFAGTVASLGMKLAGYIVTGGALF